MRRQVPHVIWVVVLIVLFAGAAPARGSAPDGPASPAANLPTAAGVLGSEFQIAQTPMPYDPERPAVVYNSQRAEYLVAWRANPSLLYGQRVSRTGALAGAAFPIYVGSQPAVAYNAQDDQYLAVWSLDGAGGDTMIAGRLLGWDGSLLGNAFVIWSWPNRKLNHARVAWNSVRDEYFVVWQAQDSTTGALTDIAGVHVFTDGSRDTAATLIQNLYEPCCPDITYNPGPPSQLGDPGNQYYFVWRSNSSSGEYGAKDAMGTRLDWDGSLVWPVTRLSEQRSYVDNQEPAVATDQSTRYFTAWRHLDGLSYTAQIQAKVISLYGNPTSGVLPISPAMDIVYSGPPAIAAPAAPWYQRSGEFVVVWMMTTIAGRSIVGSRCIIDDVNGATCEPFTVRIETGGGASFVARATIASGARGYLVTYGAYPLAPNSGGQTVYGRLYFPPMAFLPLLTR